MESVLRPVGKITAAAVKWLRDYRRERLCCGREVNSESLQRSEISNSYLLG